MPGRVAAIGADEVVAVYSSTSPAYARARQPGGGSKPETIAFGNGGEARGGEKDDSIDKLTFGDVARIIAPALAAQDYVPCNPKDPSHTNLLVMIYWGTTTGTDHASSSPEYQIAQSFVPPPTPPPIPGVGAGNAGMATDPAMGGNIQYAERGMLQAAADASLQLSVEMANMANRQRDRQDLANAAILGYLPDVQRMSAYRMTLLNSQFQDLLSEVQESRYYVVLLAYDFQTLWRHRQRKMLWETRFSIREHRNDFDQALAGMAREASQFFGQDSHGLIRERLPESSIAFGELKVLGYEPTTKP